MNASLLRRTAFGVALVCAVAGGPARATSIYTPDPAFERYLRHVEGFMSAAGGRIDVPESAGVTVRLEYGRNDACANTTIAVSGTGPGEGVRFEDHFDLVYPSGWRAFYAMTIVVRSGCGAARVRFTGPVRLAVAIPNARAHAIYYMDAIMELGNDVHIPVGPPNEDDPRAIVFDFRSLPYWMREDGTLAVPLVPTIRLILYRQ